MESHCIFNLHLLMTNDVLRAFHVLICQLYVLFEAVSVKIFCHFLKIIFVYLNIELWEFLKNILDTGRYMITDVYPPHIYGLSVIHFNGVF